MKNKIRNFFSIPLYILTFTPFLGGVASFLERKLDEWANQK